MRYPVSSRAFFLASLLAVTLALPATAAPSLPPGQEIAGHWLAVDYMKAIEKSHSPLQAANDSSLVAILVDAAESGYVLSVTSFHEGLNYGIRGIQLKGGKIVVESDSFDDDGDSLQKLQLDYAKTADGEFLTASLWGEEKITYRKLPSTVFAYVAGLTVAGSYTDQKGQAWAFEPDGHLTWAGKPRMFEVTVDTYENSCDTFSHFDPAKPEEPTWTGFRLENGKLALYEMVEGEDTPFQCAAKPFAILTKKN